MRNLITQMLAITVNLGGKQVPAFQKIELESGNTVVAVGKWAYEKQDNVSTNEKVAAQIKSAAQAVELFEKASPSEKEGIMLSTYGKTKDGSVIAGFRCVFGPASRQNVQAGPEDFGARVANLIEEHAEFFATEAGEALLTKWGGAQPSVSYSMLKAGVAKAGLVKPATTTTTTTATSTTEASDEEVVF